MGLTALALVDSGHGRLNSRRQVSERLTVTGCMTCLVVFDLHRFLPEMVNSGVQLLPSCRQYYDRNGLSVLKDRHIVCTYVYNVY